MSGNRRNLRDERGRFRAAPGAGTELKRGGGGRAQDRPQIRSKHKRALTGPEIETFLTSLVETCNVSQAAREAERSARLFYDLKKRDAGFRAAWSEALLEGYDRLELEMIRRARFGTPRSVYFQGRKTGTTRILNDATALRLLHFHRRNVESMRSAEQRESIDGAAILEELAARLAEIRAEAAAKSGEAEDERA
jgi:hypothetical protein